jgi:hypothetical protein
MKKAVFWDVAPCRYCITRRTSETSVNAISTRRHIPEEGVLHGEKSFKYYLFPAKRGKPRAGILLLAGPFSDKITATCNQIFQRSVY